MQENVCYCLFNAMHGIGQIILCYVFAIIMMAAFSSAVSGGSKEKLPDKPSSVVQPATSHEHVAPTVPQPPMQTSATDLLSTSGTFEKVPSPAPESFEQLSIPQMQESRAALQTSVSEQSAAAASHLTTSAPADTPVQAGMTTDLSSGITKGRQIGPVPSCRLKSAQLVHFILV